MKNQNVKDYGIGEVVEKTGVTAKQFGIRGQYIYLLNYIRRLIVNIDLNSGGRIFIFSGGRFSYIYSCGVQL